MPKNEIEFNYLGWMFRVTDYDYSPGHPGNYNNPPDPPEFIINELEIEDGGRAKGWDEITGCMFDFMMEQHGEGLEEAAYNKLLEMIKDNETEREIEREEDREQGRNYSLAG